MAKGLQGPQEPVVHMAAGFGRRSREITVVVGAEYTVEPLNPQKLKHRGRQCVLVGLVRDDIGTPVKAKVRFLDNNRPGRVDLADLKAKGLTKDHGPKAPAGERAAANITPGPVATLDLLGLERDIEALLHEVSQQLKKAEGSTDRDPTLDLLFTTVMMEGMGQLLQVIGWHISEPEAKKRFAHLQQRFGGFKGATRAVTDSNIRRFQRLASKQQ